MLSFCQAEKGPGNPGPEPINPSEVTYVKLKRKLDGGTYQVQNDLLHFQYTGEYDNGKLDYHIYDTRRNDLGPSTRLNKRYGDNRYSLGLRGLASGVYTLEIINEKSEHFYLRFQK